MSCKPWKTFFASAATMALAAVLQLPALAQVVRQDDGPIATSLQMPVYQWQDTGHKPKAIVLAIHGLTMHGSMYDAWARDLVKHRMVVVAPDLRGYGKWYQDKTATSADYAHSENDLVALAEKLRRKYKGLPLLVAGESLGGSLAIRMAGNHPDLVDGLILSAPAIKHHHRVPFKTIANATLLLANPTHKIDVSGYLKNYFSDDPSIGAEELSDPLVRKNLSAGELFSSCRLIASSENCIERIPANMPVLILQGKKDAMVKLSSVGILQKRLRTRNQTVHWFPARGHILLETKHIAPETLVTVDSWLAKNCTVRTLEGTAVAASQPMLSHGS